MSAIYENMMRRASIIFMNRGPIEARFPFLETQVCEFCLGIDPKWLSISPENVELLLTYIEERAGSSSTWTEHLTVIYDYMTKYLNGNGNHPEGTDENLACEMEKLFWKFPLIVAGMHAAEESYLPFHCLLFPKLRGQHGSGLTSLEPKIVEYYQDIGSTDTEIFKSIVKKAFSLDEDDASCGGKINAN
jgi:hypothetical protein